MHLQDRPEPVSLDGSRVRVVYGPGRLRELGRQVKAAGGRRVLLVTDPGICASGHVDRAVGYLEAENLAVSVFDGVKENPTTVEVAHGIEAARKHETDFLVGLGGGSSLDCTKGINFLLTNGGKMADYWGRGKATKPMLPSIGVPTTAGTGSEAQCFALISDPDTGQKMACGDEKAAFRVAILDAELTETQPRQVAALTGLDAISHAIETSATKTRTDLSRSYAQKAWHLMSLAFVRALKDPEDSRARIAMLVGAHLSGIAIENSMLGAAHACANPLTARIDLVHGLAVAIMLPHVVRFNSSNGQMPYADLSADPEEVASKVTGFLDAAELPTRLRECGVTEEMIPGLAGEAETQWTAQHNPRPVDAAACEQLYRAAL